jgi:outer membrane scaffolding protein for murein synthesis (MipA/OmpV family)
MPKNSGMRVFLATVGLVLSIGVAPARATHETDGTPNMTWPWVFGGAASWPATTDPYRDGPTLQRLMPSFSYGSEPRYSRGAWEGGAFLQGESWAIGPVVKPHIESYGFDGGVAPVGMRGRPDTVNAGLGACWRTSVGMFSISWAADVLGSHGGSETEFAYTLTVPWNGFWIVPSVGVRCKSGSLSNYYYGVQSDETFPGRPSYKAGSAIDPFARVAVLRGLIGGINALAAVQCEWFDGEIRGSPLVERSCGISVLLGLVCAF